MDEHCTGYPSEADPAQESNAAAGTGSEQPALAVQQQIVDRTVDLSKELGAPSLLVSPSCLSWHPSEAAGLQERQQNRQPVDKTTGVFLELNAASQSLLGTESRQLPCCPAIAFKLGGCTQGFCATPRQACA